MFLFTIHLRQNLIHQPHLFLPTSALSYFCTTLLLPVKLALFFLIGSVSTLLSISAQTANRLRQVENDRLKAELQKFKAQIHTHFLFNTLNSIYSLVIRNDERTADTIVKLSEFMRYIIRG
jgi:LytS/YehU family sensor histidine kinase